MKHFLILLGLLSFFQSSAQEIKSYPGFYDEMNNKISVDSSAKLLINKINIIGNNKTKDYIILREMKIKKGDSIIAANLFEAIEESHNLIYNTSLFSEVAIEPVLTTAFTLTLNIILKERWYIYPTPQFKLVDRNFNEWWKTYNADFNRVIYGAKFLHYNISGRGDQLRIFLQNGYARNFSISYSSPYSNKRLDEGYSIGFNLTQNREFPYKTSYNNGLLLYKKSNFERDGVLINATYISRKGYFKKHYFSFLFNYIKVNDSVLTSPYNPHYLNSTKSSISFPDLIYTYSYNNTNKVDFPLKGKSYSFSIVKRGLGLSDGINMFAFDATFKKYFTLRNHFYTNIQLFTKVKLPFKQPYINQRSLGYGNFYLRGLEYYVIDGVAAALSKYTISKKIVSFKIPVPFNIKAIPYIPFSFYAKTFADAGFSYNSKEYDTRLNNTLLYTGGIGIDMLTLYDININLEYSFNQLREKGLFLHVKGSL